MIGWRSQSLFASDNRSSTIIISKTLSEKQISINPKISDFIINNVERSYEKMFKFLKEVDELSLSTGKSININLIKKVLNQ